MKGNRGSTGSLHGKFDMGSSFRSDRKDSSTPKNLNTSSSSKQCKYFGNPKGSKGNVSESKIFKDQSINKKNNKTKPMKNMKANKSEKSSDVPTVELDFSASTIENGPPSCPNQAHKPSMFSRKSSLKKYINSGEEDKKSVIITSFAPKPPNATKVDKEDVVELSPNKIESAKRICKIITSHILMNSMIRWIENGFMHAPRGSVSPIQEKEEILEYSSIEKDYNHYLQPITEESLGEIENDNNSSEKKQLNNYTYKLDKLRNAIDICNNIENKPEIMLLKAFKEWKRLGIKISLERLLQYREALDKLQSMPMSEEEYYYEGEESELSQS